MLGAVVLVLGLIAFQLDAKGSVEQQTVAQVAPEAEAAPAPATTLPTPPTPTTLPPPEPTVSVPANPNVRSLTPEEMVLLEQRLTEDEVEEEPEAAEEEEEAPAEPPPPPEPTAAPATTPAPVATAEPVVTPEPTPEPTPEATPEESPTEAARTGGGGMPAGTTEEMWHELRECESGNNYTLAHGAYYGAYQFSPATWDWLAADYYPELVGVLPSDASPADQTKMAYALYEASGKGQWPVCGQHFP